MFLLKVKIVQFHYFCVTFFKVLLRNFILAFQHKCGSKIQHKSLGYFWSVSGCGFIGGDYCFLFPQHLIFKTLQDKIDHGVSQIIDIGVNIWSRWYLHCYLEITYSRFLHESTE